MANTAATDTASTAGPNCSEARCTRPATKAAPRYIAAIQEVPSSHCSGRIGVPPFSAIMDNSGSMVPRYGNRATTIRAQNAAAPVERPQCTSASRKSRNAQAQTPMAAMAAAGLAIQLLTLLEVLRVPIHPSTPAASTAATGPTWTNAPKMNASAALTADFVRGTCSAYRDATAERPTASRATQVSPTPCLKSSSSTPTRAKHPLATIRSQRRSADGG